MKRRALFFTGFFACAAFAGVEEDWQQITALEAGPQTKWKTRDEARAVTLAHFARQEKSLRAFAAAHPADPRSIEARLRLAHLLATRGDLQGSVNARTEAAQILDRLAQDVPAERHADVEFAKISLSMQQFASGGKDDRDALLNKAQTFEKAFPQDRRIPALLAEVATLFDAEPARKKALLERASIGADEAALRGRIADDLRRLALLGQPLSLRTTSLHGGVIDLEKWRGQVVLVYFFAAWSPPSLAALELVRDLAASYPKVQALGISLDEEPAGLEALLRLHKITWPIGWEKQGWQSPLVRALGINALPTFWIVDRAGRLRTLNARADAPALIEQLLREP